MEVPVIEILFLSPIIRPFLLLKEFEDALCSDLCGHAKLVPPNRQAVMSSVVVLLTRRYFALKRINSSEGSKQGVNERRDGDDRSPCIDHQPDEKR